MWGLQDVTGKRSEVVVQVKNRKGGGGIHNRRAGGRADWRADREKVGCCNTVGDKGGGEQWEAPRPGCCLAWRMKTPTGGGWRHQARKVPHKT